MGERQHQLSPATLSGREDAGLSEACVDFPILAHWDLPSSMATFGFLQLTTWRTRHWAFWLDQINGQVWPRCFSWCYFSSVYSLWFTGNFLRQALGLGLEALRVLWQVKMSETCERRHLRASVHNQPVYPIWGLRCDELKPTKPQVPAVTKSIKLHLSIYFLHHPAAKPSHGPCTRQSHQGEEPRIPSSGAMPLQCWGQSARNDLPLRINQPIFKKNLWLKDTHVIRTSPLLSFCPHTLNFQIWTEFIPTSGNHVIV